jgi:deoxyribodipyrimidine photo-lyase
MSRSIYWFRNDLRIEDNEALIKAGVESKEVLPVYILDRKWLEGELLGIERIGAHRLKFLLESLTDLKQKLKSIGSDLMFRIGDPIEEIEEIKKDFHCEKLYAQANCAHEETSAERILKTKMESYFIWGETLYHLNDLPFDLNELPDVFTQFRKLVEKKALVREELEAPLFLKSPDQFGTEIPTLEALGFENPKLDERSVLHFRGGAQAAQDRLQYYLWDNELISNYKQTRNGLIGGDYSSKFSPWLANGCISARQIYWQIKKYERYIKKNSSTYWLVFELIWRDYFHFVASKYGAKIYRRSGISGVEKIEWKSDKLFHLWRDGRTKEPFVDANMREMNATGFMSNRGRQVVASYLMHIMKIDWRLGAAYFEKMLIDFDPCSNYGNWIYIAGVGNDPRGGREFNIARQKEIYDPQCEYQDLWSA